MKSTPAVFLTSLAVSAFSMIIPIPAASTVFDLFIGEDLALQEVNRAADRHLTSERQEKDASPACQNTCKRSGQETQDADFTVTAGFSDFINTLSDQSVKYAGRVTNYTQGLLVKPQASAYRALQTTLKAATW